MNDTELTHWISELNRYLRDLGEAQQSLESGMQALLAAIAKANPAEIQQQVSFQQQAALRLQELHKHRQDMLDRFRSHRQAAETLTDLSACLADCLRERGVDVASLLQPDQLRHLKSQAVRVNRTNWQQWILASRSHQHYHELRTLIANAGRAPLSMNGSRAEQKGGSLLDASA